MRKIFFQHQKNLFLTITCGIMLLFTSCAKNITVNLSNSSTSTGRVIVEPTKGTDGTYVTLNDSLIVKKKAVKSVIINNIPAGTHKIHYSCDNSFYKEKLDTVITVKVAKDKHINKVVEVPPYSAGYWILVSLCAILPWLPLLAL